MKFKYRVNVLVGGIVTASFLALIQFVTFDKKFELSSLILSKMFVITGPEAPRKGEGDTAIYELCRYLPL